MKRFSIWCSLIFLLALLFPERSRAQVNDSSEVEDSVYYIAYIPTHSWSASIGYSSIPSVFTESSFLPDNFELQWWLNQRFYFQVGVFTQPDDIIPDNYFFSKGFATYAGTTFKLYLFKNTYFIPAWNIYYDSYPDSSNYHWKLSTGPTASFEYFFHRYRYSIAAHLLNLNYGIAKNAEETTGSLFTIHWAMGLSLRYNFDLSRSSTHSEEPQ